MKLRLRGNSLRLRLTKTEVADLTRLGAIEESTQAGPGSDGLFGYRVETSTAAAAVSSRFTGSQMVVILPAKAAQDWAVGDEVGIYADMPWGLKLSIEKDFRCLTPRPEESDDDAFDHPEGEGHSDCSAKDE